MNRRATRIPRARPAAGRARAQSWEAPAEATSLNPLLSILPFTEKNPRLNAALTVGLFLLIVASRLAAFPASIWEQDEAYFACAVQQVDLHANHPHPPFFPLWILLGKAVHAAGVEPAKGLQLFSAAFSCWMLFPLVALWSRLLRNDLAIAAAVLFLALPGPWIFAGRAFSETAATALLVAALAWWVQTPLTRAAAIAGSTAAALASLIRPQFGLPVLGAAAVLLLAKKARWTDVVVPLAALGCAGALWVIVAGGGVRPVLDALARHAAYQFGGLAHVSYAFPTSGLARCLLHPAAAGAWLLLAVVGTVRVQRGRHAGAARVLVVGACLPLVVTVYGLSNPVHARYFVPLLALTSGLVLAAAERLTGRWTALIAAVGVGAAAWAVVPQLAAYRRAISPPLLAIRAAVADARQRKGVLVADRTLVSFIDYERASQRLGVPVVYDFLIEQGVTVPPPPDLTTAVFDAGRGGLLLGAGGQTTYSCAIPILRRLGSDRFLEVTVASGAGLENHKPGGGPFVLM